MPIFLHALALQNFRGIGPQIQKLYSFRDFNFFIGANNAGKSTILNFLHKQLNSFGNGARLSNLDEHRGKQTGPLTAALGIPFKMFLDNVIQRITKSKQIPQHLTEFIAKFYQRLADENVIWIKLPIGSSGRPDYLVRPTANEIRPEMEDRLVLQGFSFLTGAGLKPRRENGSSLRAQRIGAKQSGAYRIGWIPAYGGVSGKSKFRSSPRKRGSRLRFRPGLLRRETHHRVHHFGLDALRSSQ